MKLSDAQKVWRACSSAARQEYVEEQGNSDYHVQDRIAIVLIANKLFDAVTERQGGGRGPVREVDLELLDDRNLD